MYTQIYSDHDATVHENAMSNFLHNPICQSNLVSDVLVLEKKKTYANLIWSFGAVSQS